MNVYCFSIILVYIQSNFDGTYKIKIFLMFFMLICCCIFIIDSSIGNHLPFLI